MVYETIKSVSVEGAKILFTIEHPHVRFPGKTFCSKVKTSRSWYDFKGEITIGISRFPTAIRPDFPDIFQQFPESR